MEGRRDLRSSTSSSAFENESSREGRLTVAELIWDPARATQVPMEAVSAVLHQVCGQEAALAAVKAILAARLTSLTTPAAVSREPEDTSDVVQLQEAMRITGRTEDWLRRHWRTYGLASQDGPRSRLRWSRKRCQQYHGRHLIRPAA